MSTSLLYHGFGVRDYRYVKTEYVGGGVVFAIRNDDRRVLGVEVPETGKG